MTGKAIEFPVVPKAAMEPLSQNSNDDDDDDDDGDDDSVKINLTDDLVLAKKSKKVPKYLQNATLKQPKHPTERHLVLYFLVSVVGVTFAIVLGVPFMIVTTVVLYPLTILLRFALNNCCQCLKRRACKCHVTDAGLAPNDAIWHHVNPFGTNVSHALLFFEKGVGLTKIREMLLRRVVTVENSRGQRVYPRFAQKVLPLTAGYCWLDDGQFDIDNHVCGAPLVARTRGGLESYLGALVNRTLHPERPPWEVQVLTNYGEEEDTVLIVRVHHCLSDAISLVKILKRSVSDVQSNCNMKPRFGGTAFPLNVFRAFIVGPLTLLSWLLFVRRDYNLLTHRQPFSGTKRLAWSDDISLTKVVRIKQVSRSSLNDVVLAALTGSLRSYFQKNGVARPHKMKASIAVDLRYESRSGKRAIRMGSKFSLVNVTLPTQHEGAIPRLWEVRTIMDDLKTSADPVVMYGAIHFLETFLPQCISRRILGRILNRASLLYNNIPGPEGNLHSLSMRLKSIVCFVPPRDSVPVSVTVTTHADVIKLAVLVDEAFMMDPKLVIDGFASQIDIMANILASRRIPGEHRRRSYFIISGNHFKQSPPMEEIQSKLHAVQDEMHEITQRLEALANSNDEKCDQFSDAAFAQQHLRTRMEELKEEFSELISELRRRKSLADGVPLSDEEEDLDGEVRRPRKRTLSMSSRKASITSHTSTARPLTTPTTSYHSTLTSGGHVDGEISSPEKNKEYIPIQDSV